MKRKRSVVVVGMLFGFLFIASGFIGDPNATFYSVDFINDSEGRTVFPMSPAIGGAPGDPIYSIWRGSAAFEDDYDADYNDFICDIEVYVDGPDEYIQAMDFRFTGRAMGAGYHHVLQLMTLGLTGWNSG